MQRYSAYVFPMVLAFLIGNSLFRAQAQAQATPNEADAITKLVQDSQRTGHEHHDFAAFMAIWSDDAKIICGRTSKPDKYDTVFSRDQFGERELIRFKVPAPKGTKLEFMDARVEVSGDKAVLRYRSVLKTDDDSSTVDEIYRLRKTGGKWKAYENRWWPIDNRIDNETTTYDAATWVKLDSEVQRARVVNHLPGQISALTNASRLQEAHAVAKKLTEELKEQALPWILRGYAAMEVCDTKDGMASFARALEIDPKAKVPDYVTAQKAD